MNAKMHLGLMNLSRANSPPTAADSSPSPTADPVGAGIDELPMIHCADEE